MRRTLAWLGGALGVAGALRALRRRPQPLPETGPDPRAEELRRRLEAAEPADAEPETEPAAEPGPAAVGAADVAPPAEPDPEPEPSDPAAAREQVHERARAWIDEMRRAGDPDAAGRGQ